MLPVDGGQALALDQRAERSESADDGPIRSRRGSHERRSHQTAACRRAVRLADVAKRGSLRPARPPRCARPGAREHLARLRASAGDRRDDARARRGDHPRRRAGDFARSGAQPRDHPWPRRSIPASAWPADPPPQPGRAAPIRTGPDQARFALRGAVPRPGGGRRHPAGHTGRAVRAGSTIGQRDRSLRHRDQGFAAGAR